ncbi:MAG: carbohydrate binding family 9 domain-containing protein [Gammaproteobacteria bacterium]|nr:carbohydrate binding family 9 domain-containing protein [Gammaproteobacteria bacterium]
MTRTPSMARRVSRLPLSAALFAALLPVVAAGETAQRPDTAPSMTASPLTTAPIIDGDVLGDAAWADAEPATGFWQTKPNDGAAATQRTEVYVGFTGSALLIGVVALDDSPAEIIVTDSRRDSDLDNTDAFLVIIDGQLDRQNGYIFGTNAAGIEYDGQLVPEATTNFRFGEGFNRNWDGSWSVQSRIGDYG